MSTGSTATARKKTTVKKNNGSYSSARADDLDKIRLRLFEPKREKREYHLDAHILKLVSNYEDYLTEAFDEKPPSNKVIEILLENSLKGNSPFQNWLAAKASLPVVISDLDADNLLENLNEKPKTETSL